jgi:DNA/RNA-binding domain of Phe-tRNA-synthetase-like protein
MLVEPHPTLDLGAFVADFSAAIDASPDWLRAMLVPAAIDEATRAAVRDSLRGFGYKPTGRGKPASEYLARGGVPSINAAVDAGNAISLATGLPVSVVDVDRLTPPLRVALAPPGASYVFNAAGQSIDVAGLPCLFDAEGPCANAVKDAQRTKTSADTRNTLSVVWGTRAWTDRASSVGRWYRDLVEASGARTESIA